MSFLGTVVPLDMSRVEPAVRPSGGWGTLGPCSWGLEWPYGIPRDPGSCGHLSAGHWPSMWVAHPVGLGLGQQVLKVCAWEELIVIKYLPVICWFDNLDPGFLGAFLLVAPGGQGQ